MEDNFTTRMQSLTDEELMDVIIDKRTHYNAEALKAADREMYKRVLENPALSKRMTERRSAQVNPQALSNLENWKMARWGIMSFCIILFIYEVIAKNYVGVAFIVLLNYLAAVLIVRKLFAQGKAFGHPFAFGIFVSAMLLIVRFTFEMVYQAVAQ